MSAQHASKKPSFSAASGARISRFALIRRCMGDYLSPILVDSILTKAMTARGIAFRPESDDLLPGLVEECVVGLRLFVDPERLPELVSRLRVLAAKDD